MFLRVPSRSSTKAQRVDTNEQSLILVLRPRPHPAEPNLRQARKRLLEVIPNAITHGLTDPKQTISIPGESVRKLNISNFLLLPHIASLLWWSPVRETAAGFLTKQF